MADRGEAAGYYNDDNAPKSYPMQPQNGYQQQYQQPQYQQQQQYQPQQQGGPQYQNGQQYQQYSQEPPNYNQGQSYAPVGFGGGEKPTFEQAFKIEKPKWNDLWAGILFLIVCAGFVAVSGISIQGYGECRWIVSEIQY